MTTRTRVAALAAGLALAVTSLSGCQWLAAADVTIVPTGHRYAEPHAPRDGAGTRDAATTRRPR